MLQKKVFNEVIVMNQYGGANSYLTVNSKIAMSKEFKIRVPNELTESTNKRRIFQNLNSGNFEKYISNTPIEKK